MGVYCIGEVYTRNKQKEREICIVITIWQEIILQEVYCCVEMGYKTVMYYKCSHVLNLLKGGRKKFPPFNIFIPCLEGGTQKVLDLRFHPSPSPPRIMTSPQERRDMKMT